MSFENSEEIYGLLYQRTLINNPDTDRTKTVENNYQFNTNYFFRWLESSITSIDIENNNNELITETINSLPVIKHFGNKRIFFYVPTSLTKIHHTGDESSDYVKTTRSEQYYSETDIEYGNITSATVYTDPEKFGLTAPTQAYDFYSSSSYTYFPPDLNNWFIDLQDEVITKKWDKEDGVCFEYKVNYTYYPNTPYVSTISQLPNNANEFLTRETITYWDYGSNNSGNIKSSTLEAPNFSPSVLSRTTNYNYSNDTRFLVETKNTLDGVDYIKSATYYPKIGLIKSTTDIGGLTTNYYYDGFGRLEKTIDPLGIQSMSKLYWAHNHADNPENGLFCTWYQISGKHPIISFANKLLQELLTTSKDFNEKKIYKNTLYNEYGQVEESSNTHYSAADAIWTQYDYISTGPIKKVTTPTATTEYLYNGRIKTTTNTTTNNFSTQESNAIGLVEKVTDNGGIIDYSFYSSGKHKSISTGGSTIDYTYDALGNIETLTDPNTMSIEYDYNPFGEIVSQKNANGNTYVMEYDGLGRLKSKTLQGSVDDIVDYTYCPENTNGFGQIQNVSKANGIQTNYSYDKYSRVIDKSQTIDSKNYNFHFTYNVFGTISKKTWPSGFAVNYHYKKGYFSALEQSSTGIMLWKLEDINAQGKILQYQLGNGLLTTKEFDNYSFPVSIYTENNVQNHTYDFNTITGNLNWRESGIYPPHGSHTLKEVFTYDHTSLNNRLETWKVGNGTLYSNTYKLNGNIENKTDIGTFAYNTQGERPHVVSKIEDPTESYLETAKANNQFITYTGFDKTKTITQFNPDNLEQSSFLELTYGPEQSRRKSVLYKDKELVKKRYFIGNSLEIEEDANNDKSELHYLNAGDGLFAIYVINNKGDGAMYYIHKDYLGSFETITNQEGEVVERLSFDPWGRRRNASNWSYDDLPDSYLFCRGYTGHEHLDEFDIVNMNGRTYDPLLGRFLSPDNYVQAPYYTQSYNRYSYVLNNPLKYTDPSGEFAEWIAVGIFATYMYLKTAYDNRDENGKWAWNPSKWNMDDNEVRIGINTNSDFSSFTYFGSAGPSSFSPGVSYNTDQGFGIGGTQNGNSSFFYPNYNYNAPVQNADASIDKTIAMHYDDWHVGSAGGGELQPLYGWSVDVTIAAAVGYTVEFGEIHDPNTGRTQQFISNGPAFGAEATAGVNTIFIFPKNNFKFSDLQETSWGVSVSFKGSFSISGNSTPGYSGGTQFDSYYMIKVGIGPGAGFNNTPESNAHFINWIPSMLWWE